MASASPHRAVPERPDPAAGRRDPAAEIRGPLARATTIGLVGAAVIVLVGGVLASTAGLLFVAAATGAGIGLALAQAAVPSPAAETETAALTRRQAARWSVATASLAIGLGAVGTWLVARSEGGTLGPIDYLWTTFGWFVPAQLLFAALAAAWGARAGPIMR